MPIKVYRVLHKSGAWSRLEVTATKGLTLGDSAEAKLDKLERVLAGYHWPLTEVIPLFAALLSLPAPARYSRVQLSPHRQKQRTQAWRLARS